MWLNSSAERGQQQKEPQQQSLSGTTEIYQQTFSWTTYVLTTILLVG